MYQHNDEGESSAECLRIRFTGKKERVHIVKLCGIPRWINKDMSRPMKAGKLAAGGRVEVTEEK